MKIVENKKLFGKINILDCIIILIILVVGITVYGIVFKSDTSNSVGAQYFETTYVAKLDDLPVGASNFLKLGAAVYENEKNTYIGKVVEINSGDYIKIEENYETNTYVETKVPNKETVYITISVDVADQGPDLATTGSYVIKVGKSINLRSTNFAGNGYIIKIDRGDK